MDKDSISRTNGWIFVKVVERSDEEAGRVGCGGCVRDILRVWNVHHTYGYPGNEVLIDNALVTDVFSEIYLRVVTGVLVVGRRTVPFIVFIS